MDLQVLNNSTTNPLSLDLTSYIQVNDDSMDPASPSFTDKVISHSLLKEGGVLALTDLKNKEIVFPLLLNGSTQTAVFKLVVKLNQILESPGATVSWQDDGASQATIFDLIGGQFDVEYNYRKGQQAYTQGKLRLFTQPLGHTANPRFLAGGSAFGPLLMISPYASGGALSVNASTQAGVSGFGGRPQGASSGIFYGAPSLAGDAPALLQMLIAGPSTAGPTAFDSSMIAPPPSVAVSILPDQNYVPLRTVQDFAFVIYGDTTVKTGRNAVASQYINVPPGEIDGDLVYLNPGVLFFGDGQTSWAGQHRLFAIARASSSLADTANPTISLIPDGVVVGQSIVSPVPVGRDWQLIDLGTIGLQASQPAPFTAITGQLTTASAALDITALINLPDSSTWFLQGGSPYFQMYDSISTWDGYNQVILDDVAGAQSVGPLSNAPYADPPSGQIGAPISRYSRGLVPRPDPKNGLPIIAVLAVSNGSPPNTLNQQISAYVNVLERTRYVLP